MATEIVYTVVCDYKGKQFTRYVESVDALRKECARRGYTIVSVSEQKTVESVSPVGVRF